MHGVNAARGQAPLFNHLVLAFQLIVLRRPSFFIFPSTRIQQSEEKVKRSISLSPLLCLRADHVPDYSS
jgi:hypothetical protein